MLGILFIASMQFFDVSLMMDKVNFKAFAGIAFTGQIFRPFQNQKSIPFLHELFHILRQEGSF